MELLARNPILEHIVGTIAGILEMIAVVEHIHHNSHRSLSLCASGA